jgi:hypothetical protein
LTGTSINLSTATESGDVLWASYTH